MTLDDLRRNRNLLFWALHTLGWSAYLITQYLGALLYEKPASYIKVLARRRRERVPALGAAALSLPLALGAAAGRHHSRSCCSPPWPTALVWRAVINTSYMHCSTTTGTCTTSPGTAFSPARSARRTCCVCWSGLYFGIKYYETLQHQRETVLKASALAQEAQVKMLRYQLNPHFLFNTLNAISTLILDGQGKTANQAVGRLSDFLRYTLDQDPMKKVTLRAGNRRAEPVPRHRAAALRRPAASIEFDVDERVEPGTGAVAVLQPLIENALKYAVAPREEGGRLRIEARVSGG